MGVTMQRAMQLYSIKAGGGKLTKSEQAELDDYEKRFKKKDYFEPCI